MLTFNLDKYSLNTNGIMLDVGCGEGRHIFGMMQQNPLMQCIGLDMDKRSLEKAEEGYAYFKTLSQAGVDFLIGSAYSIPLPNNSVDIVICSEVLEHLHEYNLSLIHI